MIWDEFLRHFRFCDEEDSGLSDEFRFCDEEDSGLSDEEQERKGPKNRPKHTRKRIHQAKKNFLEKFKTASTLLGNLNRLLANPTEVKNAVVLRQPMKYISVSGCRYIQSQLQYIFNRSCSIYSIAVAVYIHFSGVLAVCGAHFIFIRLSYSETHLHLG